MDNKILWHIIDDLRNDVNCHIDTITDMDAEIDKLQAENKDLVSACNMLREDYKSVEVHCDRLVKQVSSNRGSNSNTHTHITKEVNDYMNHHPEHSEVRLFILPIESFDDDGMLEVTWLLWDDGIEV